MRNPSSAADSAKALRCSSPYALSRLVNINSSALQSKKKLCMSPLFVQRPLNMALWTCLFYSIIRVITDLRIVAVYGVCGSIVLASRKKRGMMDENNLVRIRNRPVIVKTANDPMCRRRRYWKHILK